MALQRWMSNYEGQKVIPVGCVLLAVKGGEGVRVCPLRKKELRNVYFKTCSRSKPEGGGGLKVLVDFPLKKKNFLCGFPYE